MFKSDAREYDFRIVDSTTKGAATHNYANVDVTAIRADLKTKGIAPADIESFVKKFLAR